MRDRSIFQRMISPQSTMSARRFTTGALLLAASTVTLTGCDTISEITGMVSMAKGLSENLEKDIKAPLTNERISKVLEVLPKLTKFSEEAKVKWKPDPEDHDMAQLGTMLAGMSEYAAFFESHDTRLSQFYVDFAKIADCRSVVHLREGIENSREKLKEEAEQLKEKLKDASDKEKPELERRLKQAELTLEKLDAGREEADQVRSKQQESTGYKITPEEQSLVDARAKEIDEVFQAAGVAKKNQKSVAQNSDEASPPESEEPSEEGAKDAPEK